MSAPETFAVVLAAGRSKRMNSDLPKVLHSVFGRRMIDYVLDAVRAAGVTRTLVVIGHEGLTVEKELSDRDDVEFVWQDNPQGTGHAVMMCEENLRNETGRVLVLAGDTPLLQPESLLALLAIQENQSAACVIGSAITENNFGLGRVVRDPAGKFQKIVEQKDADEVEQQITEINTGCYVFSIPQLLESLTQIETDNKQGELYLTDCPAILLSQGETVVAAPELTIEEAMGVNTREQLASVRRVLHWKHLAKLMAEGVGVLAPEHVDIDPRATIGRDTIIHPFTSICGAVQIGKNCEIGPHAVVSGKIEIPDGTRIPPFTHRD